MEMEVKVKHFIWEISRNRSLFSFEKKNIFFLEFNYDNEHIYLNIKTISITGPSQLFLETYGGVDLPGVGEHSHVLPLPLQALQVGHRTQGLAEIHVVKSIMNQGILTPKSQCITITIKVYFPVKSRDIHCA